MAENFWIGDNELVIIWKDGRYAVNEAHENYECVFWGSYEACFNYCQKRLMAYEESRWF